MRTSKVIVGLCIAGFLISLYLTYLHYAPEELDASFCNISDFLSCSTVNKSSYATLFGIPVALIGIIGFVLLGFLSLARLMYARVALFYSSLGALLFMLYLTFVELFIINAVCVLCIAVLLIMAAIFSVSCYSYGRESVRFVREMKFE
ncbi:MAG TPA: vitamin K epoxide reductase family protein [Candidatus Nanoarchaeia archaeon]|nr:vitamin K epoxide reductase family protein [Candidatus Nanoarchaeia archaeon]